MSWRVSLIDSCGSWPGAVDAAAFVSAGERVERRATTVDPSGHGSRIAQLWAAGDAEFELLLGQVFLSREPASGAAVAAAVDWAVASGADLIHMSLGLEADRAVLAAAVARALESGCLVVAAMPARGALVYPAAYPEVIRATGDARCAPGELSCLGPGFFGGCARFAASGPGDFGGGPGDRAVGGASVGAAWVTRNILSRPRPRPRPRLRLRPGQATATASATVAALTASARYTGRERKGAVQAGTPLHEVPLDDVIRGGRREFSPQRQVELADDGLHQHECGRGEHHDEADPQRKLHP